MKQCRSKKIPLWNFDQILKIEQKYQAKSTFFFLALDHGNNDFRYNIEDLQGEIGNIQDNNGEIGLHGSLEAYKNIELLRSEKTRLERITGHPVSGYRNHYLKFSIPQTWNLLCQAGFRYDTTMGFADCIGFRNGMCHPFTLFDLQQNKKIDLVEIPLVIMDQSLFHPFMRLDMSTAWNITKEMIDKVEKAKGVMTILWHNQDMTGENCRFYEKILDYCSKKNAWITNCEDIVSSFSTI